MQKLLILLVIIMSGSLLTQSFQCSSKEMSTAKSAMQKKEYSKALENLKVELKKNPKNEEALMMMVKVNYEKADYEQAAKMLQKNRPEIKTPKYITELNNLEYNIWYKAYDAGRKQFQAKKYDNALKNFNSALSLRPNKLILHFLSALSYENKKDQKKAVESFKKYIDILGKKSSFPLSKGITLKSSRDNALKMLGTPVKTTVTYNKSIKDSVYADKFTVNGSDFILYSETSSARQIVAGWDMNFAENCSDQEKMQWTRTEIVPLEALAQTAYDTKQYDLAIQTMKFLTKLDPQNTNAKSLIIVLYRKAGKLGEAYEALTLQIKSNPKNKDNYLAYGDLLFGEKKYKDAIVKYDEALAIDPNFEFALKNIAITYKNIAGTIQLAEKKKFDADPKYKTDQTKYFPLLEKAASYFERANKLPGLKHDILILSELSNIYLVLKQKDKINATIKKLENIEFSLESKQQKSNFFLKMMNIFGQTKQTEKMNIYKKKFEDLNK